MKMSLVFVSLIVSMALGNPSALAKDTRPQQKKKATPVRSSKDPQPGGSAEERLRQSYERAQIRKQAVMEAAQKRREENWQMLQQKRKSKGLPPLRDQGRSPHPHPNLPKKPSNN
jgi:hypothetical protein